MLPTVARRVTAVLAVVASIVQLLTAPWPVSVRAGVFATLVVAAVALFAYELGRKRGGEGAEVPSSWNRERDAVSLGGQRIVKVPSVSRNVALCTLHEDGVLYETWLPRSRGAADASADVWRGHWRVEDDELYIVVGGYSLVLREGAHGILGGKERYGDDSQPFIAAIVDPVPIERNQSWIGLKIGERGVARVIVADRSGSLLERDPFRPDPPWSGRWSVDGRLLTISVDDWELNASRLKPGIYVGSELSPIDPEQGFAVVRVLAPAA